MLRLGNAQFTERWSVEDVLVHYLYVFCIYVNVLLLSINKREKKKKKKTTFESEAKNACLQIKYYFAYWDADLHNCTAKNRQM